MICHEAGKVVRLWRAASFTTGRVLNGAFSFEHAPFGAFPFPVFILVGTAPNKSIISYS